jgi:hypothetical protein
MEKTEIRVSCEGTEEGMLVGLMLVKGLEMVE